MMKGMIQMIDASTFLLVFLGILCSILLVVLIVLSVKLIDTINRVNRIIEEVDVKLSKFDKAFSLVDILTDNMALVSDKLVDGISYVIRILFVRKSKRKEEKINE